jgi:two-component system, chemotaxis family, protein-glutamate methylesterase/glutaminase
VTMARIRVLVVEDSLTVRRRLVEVVERDPELELVGEAEDGRRAIELCQRLRPDVVTLDMMLPVMTGLTAAEYIMAYCPTPILIVSASTNRGELFKTYEALAAGAVDVLEKPRADEPAEVWEARFLATVKLVSRIKVITHPRARLGVGRPAASAPGLEARAPGRRPSLVAIGGSTGAPGAVAEILGALPPGFPLPILLLIHINEPFGAAFAEWLDGVSQLSVSTALDGEPIEPAGRVYMAPPGKHLVVRERRLRLVDGPERHSCKPSIDVLFESLARDAGPEAVACLLTGMGRDGASGLLEIRRAGGLTIAQDEATSVIFGMPREAALLGAAEAVLPLHQIARALAAQAAGRGSP